MAAKTKLSVSFPGPLWSQVCSWALGAKVNQEEAVLALVARGLASLEMPPPVAVPADVADENAWIDELLDT